MKAITSKEFNDWFTRKKVVSLVLFYVFMSVMAFVSCLDLYEPEQYTNKLGGAFIYIGFIYAALLSVAVMVDILFEEEK